MEPITITLKHPIKAGSEMVTSLTFQPLSAGVKRELKTDTTRAFSMAYELAVRLSGQPNAVINQLMGADMVAVEELMTDFLARGQATGPDPSQP